MAPIKRSTAANGNLRRNSTLIAMVLGLPLFLIPVVALFQILLHR